jgi:hypothetical protein
MQFSGSLFAGESDIDPATEDAVVFKTQTGETLRTDQPLGKAALLVLLDAAPCPIGFAELEMRAMARLGKDAPPASAAETQALSNLLFQAVRTGLLDAYVEAPVLTNAISERPKASGLARYQLAMGMDLVTNLLHGAVFCEDDTLRLFVPLVDGSRDVAQLRDELERALIADAKLPRPAIAELTTIESVQRTLKVMAKLALLES